MLKIFQRLIKKHHIFVRISITMLFKLNLLNIFKKMRILIHNIYRLG